MTRLAGTTVAGLVLVAGSVVPAAVAQQPPVEQIVNGDFEAGLAPWWHTGNLAPVDRRRPAVRRRPGPTTNPWDAIIGQDNIDIIEGETYQFSFDASSTPRDVTVRALIQDPTTFATFVDRNPALTGDDQHVQLHVHRQLQPRHRGRSRSRSAAPAEPVDALHRRRVAARRRRARAVRARHRPAGPRQPGRLPARWPEARDAGHRGDAAGPRGSSHDAAGAVVARGTHATRRRRPDVGAERPRDRLLRLRHAGHRLHAHRRRGDEPPVRHRRRRLRAAAARRARLLLPAAQRHADRRRDRRRRVRPRGRARRRGAQPGRRRRALPAGRGLAADLRRAVDLRLHARRASAAGTTPATTASTSSTAASRSPSC